MGSLFLVGAFLIVWTLFHVTIKSYRKVTHKSIMLRDEKQAKELVNHLKYIPKKRNGGWSKYAPVIVALIISIIIAIIVHNIPTENVITYTAPEYIGIAKVRAPHRYKIYNIKTDQYFEIETCKKSNEQWYAGHVMSWVAFLNTGKCQLMGPKGLGYKIVRDDDRTGWHTLYGYLTKDDGPGRPVLALNCNNTLDDKDTVCEGGEAHFTQETTNVN